LGKELACAMPLPYPSSGEPPGQQESTCHVAETLCAARCIAAHTAACPTIPTSATSQKAPAHAQSAAVWHAAAAAPMAHVPPPNLPGTNQSLRLYPLSDHWVYIGTINEVKCYLIVR
jgi:hypothetical protein